MNSRWIALLVAGLMAIGFSFPVVAQDEVSALNLERSLTQYPYYVSFNYPGVGLGIQSTNSKFELRGFSSDISTIVGVRYTRNLIAMTDGNIYYGLEPLYITSFETEVTEGSGWMVGAVFGLQYYVADRISVSTDLGPYQVSITDDLSGINVSGIEMIVNAGLNFHF